MKSTNALSLSCATVLTACSSLVPVAVTCPSPPPLPEVLKTSPLTGPDLNERYNALMLEFKNSLSKVVKPNANSTSQ